MTNATLEAFRNVAREMGISLPEDAERTTEYRWTNGEMVRNYLTEEQAKAYVARLGGTYQQQV